MSTENTPTPSRPLPRVRIEQPGAERGADDVREHLDGERCIFCDVPADGREAVDKFGTRILAPTCGGCHDSPNSSFWLTSENADQWRSCPECGCIVTMKADSEMCTGCWTFRYSDQYPWYLSESRLEAIIEAAEESGDTDPTIDGIVEDGGEP